MEPVSDKNIKIQINFPQPSDSPIPTLSHTAHYNTLMASSGPVPKYFVQNYSPCEKEP
jgi:hypothetical protein